MKNKNLMYIAGTILAGLAIYKFILKPRIVKKAAAKAVENYDKAIGLPETMSNDIAGTEEFTNYTEV